MQGELLAGGIELMLVGMGTVFAFLTVLVLATGAMSAAVMRLMPPTVEAERPTDEELAAIAAAVDRHSRRGGSSST